MPQIARAVDGHRDLDAIHIISHGVAGELCFAAGPLSPVRPSSKRWRVLPAPRSRRRGALSVQQCVAGVGDSTSALRLFGPVHHLPQPALHPMET